MVDLTNLRGIPTLDAIDDEIVKRNPPRRSSGRIGMSSIGNPCSRAIWYRINNYPEPQADAFQIKCGDNGHIDEDLMADRLRMLDFLDLKTMDHKTGEQLMCEPIPGYVGYVDGLVTGLLEAPDFIHIWEHKSREEKYFNELNKLKYQNEDTALQKWDDLYYAQAIAMMDAFNFSYHFLTCSTPGLRRHTSVITKADPIYAGQLKDKAQRILDANEAPARAFDSPDFYKCKFCNYSDECWKDKFDNFNAVIQVCDDCGKVDVSKGHVCGETRNDDWMWK